MIRRNVRGMRDNDCQSYYAATYSYIKNCLVADVSIRPAITGLAESVRTRGRMKPRGFIREYHLSCSE